MRKASGLVVALLIGAASVHASERLRIQVVQTHTGIKMGVAYFAGPGNAISSVTHCTGESGAYSSEYGYHCTSADFPLTSEDAAKTPGYEFFFDIDVMMPDGARLVFHCSNILDKECAGIPSYPESTSITCTSFTSAGAHYKDCTATGPASDGIGAYEAELHGDKVTFHGTKWDRQYMKYGTWQPATEVSRAQSHTPPELTQPDPSGDAGVSLVSIDPDVLAKANAGDAVAQYKVGYDYYLGHGVVQDYSEAAFWWRKAADHGYASAQNNLGVLYTTGQGVPQSDAQAYFWEILAAARMNGSLQAQFARNRDNAALKLPSVVRLREQERAAQWFAEHSEQPEQKTQ